MSLTDLSPYRVEVEVAGSRPVRLSVLDVGPLQPPGRGTIVCVHGAAGMAEQWKHQIAHLAPHYRVIAPDLRGHGHSQQPDSAYSLEEFLWDFTQLLELRQVAEPFVLMAHSFGGPIAMTFAASQQRRLSKLVLIATGPELRINPLHAFIVRLPISLRYLERLRPFLMPKSYAPVFVIQRLIGGTVCSWRGYDLLPAIKIPTLVIAGQYDFLVPQRVIERMREMLTGERVEVVRYTGHMAHLERPAAVNRLLDRFLSGGRSWRDEGGGDGR